MTKSQWQTLPTHDPASLTQARLQLHYAVQLPMRSGRAGIKKRPDYSHSSLDYLPEQRGFACHALNAKNFRIGVILDSLTLFAADESFHEIYPLDGKNMDEAGAWVKAHLQAQNIDTENFDKGGFHLPEHPLHDGAAFAQAPHQDALAALAVWFHNADFLLQDIVKTHAALMPGPSPVYCWPHHFDIASLIALEEGDPETARSVGVGFSPGDGSFDQPYFYTSPFPIPASIQENADDDALAELIPPGFWNRTGFTACVARAEDIIKAKMDADALLAYLQDTIQKSIAVTQK